MKVASSVGNQIASNPVAAASLVGSIGIGSFLIWLLSLFGVPMGAYAAVALSGGLSTIVAYIGRVGLAGCWDLIMHGNSGNT